MDIQAMLKQAKKMQKELGEKEQELKGKTYQASVGGGVVQLSVNGGACVEYINIDESLLEKENKEELQDMIIVAMNDALAQMNADKDETMSALSGGIKMPGLF